MRKGSAERGIVVVVVVEYRGRGDGEPEHRAGYDLPAGLVNAPIDVTKVGRIQRTRIMVTFVDGILAAWKSVMCVWVS
jgi:hypothetical protein